MGGRPEASRRIAPEEVGDLIWSLKTGLPETQDELDRLAEDWTAGLMPSSPSW